MARNTFRRIWRRRQHAAAHASGAEAPAADDQGAGGTGRARISKRASGGGMVTVKVNGKRELLAHLSDQARSRRSGRCRNASGYGAGGGERGACRNRGEETASSAEMGKLTAPAWDAACSRPWRQQLRGRSPGSANAALAQTARASDTRPRSGWRITSSVMPAGATCASWPAAIFAGQEGSSLSVQRMRQLCRRASCATSAPTIAGRGDIICVVRDPRDVAAMERMRDYQRPLPRAARRAFAHGRHWPR